MPWLTAIVSNVALASLVALAAWFVQRCLRRHAIARALWLLALVKLVTPPLLSVPLAASPGRLACALGACGCARHAPAISIVRDTLPWLLLGAWSAGAAATVCVACVRWIRFRRLLAHASPAPEEWQSLAALLSVQFSIRRAPEILVVPGRLPPCVVAGRRRARLLLPADLLHRLDAAQRATLLLHELLHVKRGDHWVRMLEWTVGVAYWWLPIPRTIGRQLRICEETCCDAAVVAHLPQARRDYARLLLDVIDFAALGPRRAIRQVTAMGAAHNLEHRLRSILDPPDRTPGKRPALAIAVGLACAVLPCGLRCDFAQRPAATAATAGATAAGASRLIDDRCPEPPVSAFCCPQ